MFVNDRFVLYDVISWGFLGVVFLESNVCFLKIGKYIYNKFVFKSLLIWLKFNYE